MRSCRRSRAETIGRAGLALALGLSPLSPAAGQADTGRGRETFRTFCAACHTLGGGRLVGPDLQGVGDRRSEAWIIRFVQGPQALVAAGDSTARALFEAYGGIVMPDLPLSDEQVRQVVAHIQSGATTGPSVAQPTAATEEQVLLGQGLFQGAARFANAGPTCNSCHEVTNDAVIGGGVLARELTTVFSRLGGPGVRAILGSPPFPVMQRAYAGKPLTDGEVAALVAFLQRADEQHLLHQPRDYGPKLLAAGMTGSALLLILFSLIWRGRARGSVNQAIYDRQIKTL